MSGVYARKRKKSELQFFKVAQQLQTEITKYCMNDKRLPKKYRYNIGSKLIATVDTLLDNLIAANSIFPTTQEMLTRRLIYQANANNNCYQIQNQLIRLHNCVPSATIKSLKKIAILLHQEKNLVKAWKKSSKLMKVKEKGSSESKSTESDGVKEE